MFRGDSRLLKQVRKRRKGSLRIGLRRYKGFGKLTTLKKIKFLLKHSNKETSFISLLISRRLFITRLIVSKNRINYVTYTLFNTRANGYLFTNVIITDKLITELQTRKTRDFTLITVARFNK